MRRSAYCLYILLLVVSSPCVHLFSQSNPPKGMSIVLANKSNEVLEKVQVKGDCVNIQVEKLAPSETKVFPIEESCKCPISLGYFHSGKEVKPESIGAISGNGSGYKLIVWVEPEKKEYIITTRDYEKWLKENL